jgi:glycopeptide antibiotics resistance protein
MATVHTPVTSTKFLIAFGAALITSASIAMRALSIGVFTPDDITAILTALLGAGAVWLAPNILKSPAVSPVPASPLVKPSSTSTEVIQGLP